MLHPLPILVGPTAGGKSALAVELCLRIPGGGEIITADSMQVYRAMDIGTAKPTIAERRAVPHHLIDLIEPTESFTVEQWLRLAEQTITDVRARGRTPVIVGGTHFYIKALLEGLFEGPGADEALRAELASRPPADLRAELERIDAPTAAKLHPNDARRTIRALEVFHLTGKPLSAHQNQWDAGRVRADAVLIGLEWPAPSINPRINSRVKDMIARGLVEEAKALWSAHRLGPQAREALGYKQLIEHFEGRATLEDAVERIKIETRRFARNQRTWLRRLRTTPGSLWLTASDQPAAVLAARVLACLNIQTNH